MEDPIADLEKAYTEAEKAEHEEHERDIREGLSVLAERMAFYHGKLVAAGVYSELADKLVEQYHQRVVTPRVSFLGA